MTQMPPLVNNWLIEAGSFYLLLLIFGVCAVWALKTMFYPVMLLLVP